MLSKFAPKAAATSGAVSDWDELRFFLRVLWQLHAEQRLPLLGLWMLVNTLHKIASLSYRTPSHSSVIPAAEPVLADANKLLLKVIDELVPAFSLAGSATEVRIDLTLVSRPKTLLSDLIPTTAYKPFGRKDVAFIEGREGSWFETWQMSLGTLAAAHISLVAINGVMTQLVKAISQAKRLKKEIVPKPAKALVARKTSSKTAPPALLRGQILLPVVVQTGLESSRIRSENLSVESLRRLEATLTALNKLEEQELARFEAYSAKRVEGVRVRKAPSHRPTKRGHRERRINV